LEQKRATTKSGANQRAGVRNSGKNAQRQGKKKKKKKTKKKKKKEEPVPSQKEVGGIPGERKCQKPADYGRTCKQLLAKKENGLGGILE